jgi:hypothetical protein
LHFLLNVHFCLPKNEPKKAAVHLAFGFPALLTKSRRLGKSFPLRDTPPSRFSALGYAARLREMA